MSHDRKLAAEIRRDIQRLRGRMIDERYAAIRAEQPHLFPDEAMSLATRSVPPAPSLPKDTDV